MAKKEKDIVEETTEVVTEVVEEKTEEVKAEVKEEKPKAKKTKKSSKGKGVAVKDIPSILNSERKIEVSEAVLEIVTKKGWKQTEVTLSEEDLEVLSKVLYQVRRDAGFQVVCGDVTTRVAG